MGWREIASGSRELTAALQDLQSRTESVERFHDVPTATIVDYAGSSLPPGWLWCDGAAVSRVSYVGLFLKIGTTYGPGDGSTTFNVPGSVTPAMRVRITGDYGIIDNTDTQTFWDTVEYGQGGMVFGGGGPNYIEVPQTRLYRCAGQASFAPNANGNRQARISTAGVEIARQDAVPLTFGSAGTIINLSGSYFLSAGDQVGLYVYQSSGGALNLDNTLSWLEVVAAEGDPIGKIIRT
jgi:hypothetical protein